MSKENFSDGYWIWDDTQHGLAFISRDIKDQAAGLPTAGSASQPAKKDGMGQMRFKDAIDTLEMAKFRRLYQRRVKPSDPQVVTMQDIKDVAIFTAEREDLTPEFVQFLHTRPMDDFFRALIVYFQYYIQVYENLIVRREEAKRKLRQPIVTVLENKVRDDLADLRSMVARNYGYILMGLEDTWRYYHMGNRNNVSLSDKDRHLHECLLSISSKIVWIALLRKNFTLIEVELNRMLRTAIFNIMGRLRQLAFRTNTEENRVLLGKAFAIERKLKHRSPAVQELIFDNHSYKMLAIGHLRVEPVGKRIAYLEAAYTAPESILFEIGVGAGILGLSKDYLNPILQPKEGMAKRIHIPVFRIPEDDPDDQIVGETLPKTPPLYTESAQTKTERATQCKVWLRYVIGIPVKKVADVVSNTESQKSSSQHTNLSLQIIE